MYALCVTFHLKEGCRDEFLSLIKMQARVSRETEAGCHRFDVATDPSRPDQVFLYELYTDRAAFDVHLASTHFKVFFTATEDMVADRTYVTWADVTQ